jgi:hypothetical protein
MSDFWGGFEKAAKEDEKNKQTSKVPTIIGAGVGGAAGVKEWFFRNVGAQSLPNTKQFFEHTPFGRYYLEEGKRVGRLIPKARVAIPLGALAGALIGHYGHKAVKHVMNKKKD